MTKLSRKRKIALLSFVVLLISVAVLWYPYEKGVVPQWKLEVVDSDGRPAVGAPVNEEWDDPLKEGITSVDSRNTDANGFVEFPERLLRNRLALGTSQFRPAALITVCTADQYGEAVWEEQGQQVTGRLRLKKGSCPYA